MGLVAVKLLAFQVSFGLVQWLAFGVASVYRDREEDARATGFAVGWAAYLALAASWLWQMAQALGASWAPRL